MKASKQINDGASSPAAGATEAMQVDDGLGCLAGGGGCVYLCASYLYRWRCKRIYVPFKCRSSPPPIGTRNVREITSVLLASWVGIECLMEVKWATETLTHWTKCNSRSCYFTSVLCEGVEEVSRGGEIGKCPCVKEAAPHPTNAERMVYEDNRALPEFKSLEKGEAISDVTGAPEVYDTDQIMACTYGCVHAVDRRASGWLPMSGERARVQQNDLLLHEAVITNEAAAVRDALLRPIDVNCRNNYGRAPIHWAASRGNVEIINLLIEAGCDIEAADKSIRRRAYETAEDIIDIMNYHYLESELREYLKLRDRNETDSAIDMKIERESGNGIKSKPELGISNETESADH
ncbi:Ankyrin repeat and death domain-containing protein 1B [Eumeta japonica]|uniref:Ankyrin repeat and death domain-containing protein 1B n=1 Tax=Eumeta variegata TaxID=151549 RepID=A0A4C1U5Y9_EUMVA|nr:Ankyrin repeat and death domain-containing protein 1B [Eumeta japonica]